MRKLFPHQEAALAYAATRQRIALYMEMRLGKTLVAIRWATGPRILVVAPLSVLDGWRQELLDEGKDDADIHLLIGARDHRIAQARPVQRLMQQWYLINYEGLRVCADLANMPWHTVILDESTRIRNPKAQITKLMIRRFGHVERRAVLSGLPAPEGPMDYFCQMQFLHGAFLGTSNFWAFRERYFHADMQGYDWVPNPGTIEKIKAEVHRTSFVLTRQQANMGNKKIYEQRIVEMSPDIKRYQKIILKEFAFRDMQTKWATVQAVWLARLAGGFSPDQTRPRLVSDAKIQELIGLLKGDLKGQRAVVWFRFNEELHAVFNALVEAQLGPIHQITGATPANQRHNIVMAWSKGYSQILLMQEQVGKFGLNLSAASVSIYYSNLWEYETRAQSEDRIEHMMKKEPLLIIDLMMRGSTDMAVIRALKEKKLSAATFMRRMVQYLAEEWRTYGVAGPPEKTPEAPTTLRARVRRVFSGTGTRHL